MTLGRARWTLTQLGAVFLAVAPGVFVGAATAQNQPSPTAQTLALARAALNDLAAARAGLDAATGATDRVAALTQTIAAYEAGLDALRDGLRRAALREQVMQGEFEAESGKLSALLGVMLTVQSSPSGLMLLHPDGALDTARANLMLADVTPAFQAEVEGLRQRLKDLAELRALNESAADILATGLQGVQEARTSLSQAISNRTDLPKRFLADGDQLNRLVLSSETLESFAVGLAIIDEVNGVEAMEVAVDPKGSMPLPVEGVILRGFGEADAAGVERPGLVIATRPLRLVSAPWAATIRYYGPLLDYGNVMILELGNDTLMVLSGLNQVYGRVGEVIPAGTPIGLMGGDLPDGETFLLQASAGAGNNRSQTLYLEIRQNGEPVDPTEWFATQ